MGSAARASIIAIATNPANARAVPVRLNAPADAEELMIAFPSCPAELKRSIGYRQQLATCSITRIERGFL
jgi:hypothetical protein